MIRVSDLMTTDVLTLQPELSLKDAAGYLSDHGVSGAPVVAAAEVVGVLSTTDLVEFDSSSPGVPEETPGREEQDWGEPDDRITAAEDPGDYFVHYWDDAGADVLERFSASGSPEWDVLAEHSVEEVMSRTLYTVTPDASVTDAAQRMLDHGVHRLIVTGEDGHLEGILTAADIVRGVAEGKI